MSRLVNSIDGPQLGVTVMDRFDFLDLETQRARSVVSAWFDLLTFFALLGVFNCVIPGHFIFSHVWLEILNYRLVIAVVEIA